MSVVDVVVAPLDPFAWTKLDAQRAYIKWFRAGRTPTAEEACLALNIAQGPEPEQEFAREDPDYPRIHVACLDARDGGTGGVCLCFPDGSSPIDSECALRWGIGIALAWQMGAPLAEWGAQYQDLPDELNDAFDAIAELLLVPEEIVGDLCYRDAHKALPTVLPGLVEGAIESRTLGMKRHEAVLLAFAKELETKRAQEAA
jgi:hypothetical protein